MKMVDHSHYNFAMFMVHIVGRIVNEETDTKNIEDIFVGAHYIPMHIV